MDKKRTAEGKQQGDLIAFPSGMANLSAYIHSHDIKFGLCTCAAYSSLSVVHAAPPSSRHSRSPGTDSARCQFTCQHRPASFDYETIDAEQYAAWEVDYLKLDNCASCPNESYATALRHYSAMGAALNKTGRPIFYMSGVCVVCICDSSAPQ